MNLLRPPVRNESILGRAALVFFRAGRTTLIVGAVVLLVCGLREHHFQWSAARDLLDQNRSLLAMIFFGILIWEYWFQRSRTAHRTESGNDML